MNIIKKGIATLALLLISILLALIYGFLHNQISFSVSAEYFTCFKFMQFSIHETIHNRIGAGIAGILATWWMGIIIGIILIPIGLIIPTWQAYLRSMIRVVLTVCLTALVTGLTALFIGSISIDLENLPEFHYPSCVKDPVSFAQAGTMHNFSYLGGLLGIIIGIILIFIERKKVKKGIAATQLKIED